MKLFKNISILVLFLTICSGVFAQQQCALDLSDGSPSQGQYRAIIYIYYDGNLESTTQQFNVNLGPDNYLPFDILNDVEDNAYQINVYILEPGSSWVGPFPSGNFNTDTWRNFDIPVTAHLP